MTSDGSLEAALARTENDAQNTVKAAAAVASKVKQVLKAAQDGKLRELRSSLDACETTLATLRQQIANTRDNWDFDEEAYLADGRYLAELVATASRQDVRLYEAEDRLYCYPSLVRIMPTDRAVRIDKTLERRLRPAVLIAHLKDLQRRPPRFRAEIFLEALYQAYINVAAQHGRELIPGRVVQLTKLYDLLTLLPGSRKDYSKPEFARDIYLLDKSHVRTTRDGLEVSFPAATGTRGGAHTLQIITESGAQKVYYGIAFQQPH